MDEDGPNYSGPVESPSFETNRHGMNIENSSSLVPNSLPVPVNEGEPNCFGPLEASGFKQNGPPIEKEKGVQPNVDTMNEGCSKSPQNVTNTRISDIEHANEISNCEQDDFYDDAIQT